MSFYITFTSTSRYAAGDKSISFRLTPVNIPGAVYTTKAEAEDEAQRLRDKKASAWVGLFTVVESKE